MTMKLKNSLFKILSVHALAFSVFTINSLEVKSQGFSEYESGLKVKLNEDGSKYFRMINWNQIWLRHNENNSGSTLAGKNQSDATDISLRRIRFLTYAQLNDRFLILTHFGINNQNTFSGGAPTLGSKKPQLFFHDAYVEYKIWKKYLSVGSGMHYWNGISRMTNASTLNFMTIDAPIFNWANIDKSDQFGRYMGIYAKGKFKKFDYRFSLNDPFQANETKTISANSDYNPYATNLNTAGYVFYQFFEEESNLLPFLVGTYLGSKKVFNIGAGYQHQKNAMWHTNSIGDTLNHNQTLISVDAFLDLPLNKKRKDAITAYAVYYNYDFGPNFVRSIGILNPSEGGGALRGNAVPTIGTGSILYGQAGYLLPEFTEKYRLQPYVAYSYARFSGIRDANQAIVPVEVADVGINLYMAGHHSKWTLNYRSRPDFTNVNALKRRSEWTLQFMIYL